MQINANQLGRHLAPAGQPGKPLASVYFVTGDEPLLVEEACVDIAQAARAQGFDERTLFDAQPRAPWQELFADAGNMSLFASRRLLDVRIPARGLDRAGSDALRKYLDAPLPDTMLLARAVALEWRQRSSAWFKALGKAGVVVMAWPVPARELPRWLDARCRAAGLQLHRDAIDALAQRVEGNLLAARQEIERLKLLQPPAGSDGKAEGGVITAEQVRDAVGDSAHFDTFQLLDAAFGGHRRRVRQQLAVLQQEGVAIFLVLGALANQLGRARELSLGGKPRLPPSQRSLVAAAAKRLGTAGIDRQLAECAWLDMQAKGMLRGDAWQSLERILLAIAGSQQQTLAGEAQWLRPDWA